MSGRLLLIAQFCREDAKEMAALIRLICDLRTANKLKDSADLIFLPKPEVRRYDDSLLTYARTAFRRVSESRGSRGPTGWPMGPNALAMDAFALTHKLWKAGQFDFTAAMLVEADCVPLYPDFVERLARDYAERKRLVTGHLQFSPLPHINGNLLFHPMLFDLEPSLAFGETPKEAWDLKFWPKLEPYSAPTDLILNDYRLNTHKNPWKGCDYLYKPRLYETPHPFAGSMTRQVWLHGVKGMAGIDCIRNRYGLQGA